MAMMEGMPPGGMPMAPPPMPGPPPGGGGLQQLVAQIDAIMADPERGQAFLQELVSLVERFS